MSLAEFRLSILRAAALELLDRSGGPPYAGDLVKRLDSATMEQKSGAIRKRQGKG